MPVLSPPRALLCLPITIVPDALGPPAQSPRGLRPPSCHPGDAQPARAAQASWRWCRSAPPFGGVWCHWQGAAEWCLPKPCRESCLAHPLGCPAFWCVNSDTRLGNGCEPEWGKWQVPSTSLRPATPTPCSSAYNPVCIAPHMCRDPCHRGSLLMAPLPGCSCPAPPLPLDPVAARRVQGAGRTASTRISADLLSEEAPE